MTIRTIDRATLGTVTQQFVSELKDLADRLGIDIASGGGQYGGTTGTIKINLSVRDTGMGKSGAQQEFEHYARSYGIDPAAFGKDFAYDARKPWEIYKVSGVNPGSPKYRFSGTRNSDGRSFKFTPECLRKHFPAPKANAA